MNIHPQTKTKNFLAEGHKDSAVAKQSEEPFHILSLFPCKYTDNIINTFKFAVVFSCWRQWHVRSIKKGRYSSSWESYGTSLAIWDHTVLPATDTGERAPPNPSHAGWYSIYLPRRDGRL